MTNTNAPTAPKSSALAVMAGRYNVEPTKLLSTLKSTVFKGANDDELLALVVVANEYQLNPFLKQIYAFPGKGGGIVPIVSVDGWNSLANNHPQMDGLEFEFAHDANDELISCTSIFYRKDRTRPVKVTEYLSECVRNTEPWKMQHRMLRHKALIQGARVAFGFGGLYDEDEARDIIGHDPLANAKPVKESTPAPQFAAREDDFPPGAEVPIKHIAATAAAAAPTSDPSTARRLREVRGLLKSSGFSDLHLLNHLRSSGDVDESLASLEEVAELKPSALAAVADKWPATLAALKSAANGGAK